LRSSLTIKERGLAESPVLAPAQRRSDGPNVGTSPRETRRTWVRFLQTAWATWRTHVFAALDQAVVSGTAFLTTVLVGRWTFPSELGIYSIGFSLLASLLAFQDSLILLPYTIQRHRPSGTAAEHAGSSLMQSGLLSALAIVMMAAAALGMSAIDAEPKLTAMIWAMAAVVPFALLREFGRGFAFARLDTAKALVLDAAVATTQLGALGWLGLTGWMSATTACAALGVACALPSVAWLWFARAEFAIQPNRMREAIRQSWGLGKWLCAGQITVSVQGYATYWLLPLLLDFTATGVFAACMSIASLANPLVSAFRSTLTPRAVLAFKEGGGAKLWRQAIRDSLLLGAALTLFCLAVMLGGELAIGLLFHGQGYSGHGHIITVLAVGVMMAAVGSTASNALACMERPRAIVWAALVGAVLTIVLVWSSARAWGLIGAAYGLLGGNAAGALARWFAFFAVVSRCDRQSKPAVDPSWTDMDSDRAAVIRVLQQFARYANDGDCKIELLGEGFHARVYAVNSHNGHPIWQTHHRLVVKLYKPLSATDPELLKKEFEAQSRLHSAVDGRSINGWRICAPAPLYVSEMPAALVMTRVTGQNLELSLTTDDCLTLQSAAHAVVAAMKHYWSAGQLHGDLSFRNILCDARAGTLSFVDVDVLVNGSATDHISKEWYPASYDLAGMLYDLGIDLKNTRRLVLLRKQMFAESVLRAFLGTICSFQDRLRLLEEIRAYAQLELNKLDLSWSMRGLYHALQRQIASRRIARLLEGLTTTARVSGDWRTPNTFHFTREGTGLDR
jgi:O-antigen/teichoic acid export membrane protein/tRNA A-37 threonylcarbamoyl transferase component Bud32